MDLNALRDLAGRLAPEEVNTIQANQQNALALQSGQIDMQNKLSAQDLQHVKFGGQLAQAMNAVPADQATSIYAQYAPILKRNPGFDAQDEALFQTPQGREQIINSSRFLTPREKPVQVAAGASLVDPTTQKEIYRAPDKANNWEAENHLREMQIRQQGALTKAQIDATNAYRQSSQALQQQSIEQRGLLGASQLDLARQRMENQNSERQASAQKQDRTAQSKLTPLRDAVSVSENTFKQMTDLIQTKNFDDAVGFVDQFTAPIGRALFDTKDGSINRKAAMITKDLAGRIIKEYGSNPSTVDLVQAMQRIPNTGDNDRVWKSWYDEVLTPATQRSKLRLQQEADALGVPAYPQQQSPQAPQRPAQPQQFRSSSGITFEVQ